jgi:hypothetical protein
VPIVQPIQIGGFDLDMIDNDDEESKMENEDEIQDDGNSVNEMTDNFNDYTEKKAQNNDDSIISVGAAEEPDYAEPQPTPNKIEIQMPSNMEIDQQAVHSPRVITDLKTNLSRYDEDSFE